VSAGASRRRRGGCAGGKNRQTAEPTHARGTAIRGPGDRDQIFWPRRAGRVQSENREGERKSDRRTGNKGSRESTGALAGTAFVRYLWINQPSFLVIPQRTANSLFA